MGRSERGQGERGQHIRMFIYEFRGIVDFIVHDDVEILSTQ